jgi:general secretion pathway protein C
MLSILKYRTIFILTIIAVIVYLSVDIFFRIMNGGSVAGPVDNPSAALQTTAPVNAPQETLETYAVITEKNLFKTTDKPSMEDQMDLDSLQATTLQLELVGTVAGEGAYNYAVIEEKDKKKQRVYKIGDTINSATLVKVMRNAVILKVGNRDEVLKKRELSLKENTDTKAQGESNAGTSGFTAGQTTVSSADIANLLTQARVTPHVAAGTSGKPDGLIIQSVQPGSLFQNIGLINGDVIQEINGQAINSTKDLVELHKNIAAGSNITVKVQRTGKPVTLNYVVE